MRAPEHRSILGDADQVLEARVSGQEMLPKPISVKKGQKTAEPSEAAFPLWVLVV
jgi:hypothetical protein